MSFRQLTLISSKIWESNRNSPNRRRSTLYFNISRESKLITTLDNWPHYFKICIGSFSIGSWNLPPCVTLSDIWKQLSYHTSFFFSEAKNVQFNLKLLVSIKRFFVKCPWKKIQKNWHLNPQRKITSVLYS